MVFAFALSGGSLVIAIFLVVMVIAVAFELYTRRGSGIDKHPHHRRYSSAPGAARPDEFSDFETFENQYMGRHHPPKGPAQAPPGR